MKSAQEEKMNESATLTDLFLIIGIGILSIKITTIVYNNFIYNEPTRRFFK